VVIVAFADSAVFVNMRDEATTTPWKTPSCDTVTGSESEPFAVHVFVSVTVLEPAEDAECAYVPSLRISPPDAVTISPSVPCR
jgi:hypothetical protein